MRFQLGLAQAAFAAAIPLTSRNPASVLHDSRSIAVAATPFTCAASSWPPNTIGKANEPQLPSAELASILAHVDPRRIEATIRKLASFGTRHTLSTQTSKTRGIAAARDWIHAEFQKYADASDGRLTVQTIGYVQEPDGSRVPFATRISDVVATLKGTDANRLYVISGHYDSRNTDIQDYEGDAPGADDDASGVAVSLELARVISQPRYPIPKASIAFVAVAGEEQNLYGSRFLAQTYANSTPRVNVRKVIYRDNTYTIPPPPPRLSGPPVPAKLNHARTTNPRRVITGGRDAEQRHRRLAEGRRRRLRPEHHPAVRAGSPGDRRREQRAAGVAAADRRGERHAGAQPRALHQGGGRERGHADEGVGRIPARPVP